MDQMTDSQELARRFNEDEAVWQRYEYRRGLRLRLGIESLIPDEVLDDLDLIEAEREVRQVRCIGVQVSLRKTKHKDLPYGPASCTCRLPPRYRVPPG